MNMNMNMNFKVYNLATIISIIYIVGFFTMAPVFMLATNMQSPFMMNLVTSTDQHILCEMVR